MNKKMANSEAQFGIHEATNRVTIKIVDKQTKEIIKELPPEKTLDMIAKVWEMAIMHTIFSLKFGVILVITWARLLR